MSVLPEISRPVEIARIGTEALAKRIEIGEEERTALAAALGLVDILALSAEIELKRDRHRVIHLDGRLTAEIVQDCVVSLEPLQQAVDEPIRLRFVEGESEGTSAIGAIDIEPTDDDPPEIVSGPLLDLGPVVIEHFILAVDPYPRVPGAESPANPASEPSDGSDSPFSVLGSLVERGAGDC